MKIKESKSIIIESDNAPLKISGRDGLSAYRVAKFHEKDNKNIKHAVYRTPGGAYYNRYYVKDIYGDEDELGNKGVVGPFTSEEDAVARLKDYKKDVVKESLAKNKKLREGLYNIFYDWEDESGYVYRNNKEEFEGDWFELKDYIKQMKRNGCYNIDAVSVYEDSDIDESCKRGKIKESKEIDRKAFVSLVKLGKDPYDGYSILNDGYFVKRIYAESDEDAIRQFRDYLARKNESLNKPVRRFRRR